MLVLSKDKKWYRVSLRLWGDKLPIEEIETRLDLEASSIGRKDKHIRENPRYAKYRTNIWCSEYLTDSDVPFEKQIAVLLELLEPKADELVTILAFADVKGEISLGFSSGNGQGGATFSPELLVRVAKLKLSLGLDLYPPDIDEDEDEE